MASSSKGFLSSKEVDKVLDEIRSDSGSSFFDSDDDSSGISDLLVGEAIAVEGTEDEESDSAQNASAVQGARSAASFTWAAMSNCTGLREQFVGNCGPQNEAKNGTEGADIFKMFFTQELVEIIVCETNIYAEQCIMSRDLTMPFCSRMRDWKPVTVDKIYVVLALFMLMGIVQKPTLRSYFSKNYVLATPIFGSLLFLWTDLNQYVNSCTSATMTAKIHTKVLLNFSKYIL
jgi:hypothetical protein